ncbi:uncharacterized protein LOC128551593 [Mercenaria mercenaria]|uniref:uncharacterized protein LOC128551593 n=1 Tax=Mercenaria mercenaria TaxID=6596 RepID=UPI00234E93AE|nr:uncharacterized protein LOC128551593 [Mercenaria mercenaria]
MHPNRIWNCDETSFNMEHTPVKVYADKGEKSVVSKAQSSNLTVMACASAGGDCMPPMFITKGKTPRSVHGYRTEDAPEGSVWTYQKKGWISDEIGEQWFEQVFLKCCGPARPQLLLMDGHGSHETLAIIERVIEENIILMVSPPAPPLIVHIIFNPKIVLSSVRSNLHTTKPAHLFLMRILCIR